jgi:uncharacterized protein (DUF433 family)
LLGQYIKGDIMASRISIHPDICNGRPIIAGTRIPVQTILEFLGAGDSIEDVLEEYPSLSSEDIYACIQFGVVHFMPELG